MPMSHMVFEENAWDYVDGACKFSCTSPRLRIDRAVPRRVVSFGDLHGDLRGAWNLFRGLCLIDDAGEWIAVNTTVVQTGDVLDRGRFGVSLYEFLFRLQRNAPAKGSELVLLLGNHEVMNLQGIYQHVNDYADFGVTVTFEDVWKEPEKYVDEAFKTKFGKDSKRLWEFQQMTAEALLECINSLPEQDACSWVKDELFTLVRYHLRELVFEPRLGKRLRELPAIAWLGPEHGFSKATVFMHAGLAPHDLKEIREFDLWPDGLPLPEECVGNCLVNKINEEFRELLARGLELPSGLEGVLWDRTLAEGPDGRGPTCEGLRSSLAILEADRMVVGHTIQPDRSIHSKCNGKFFLTDTGMSVGYGAGAHNSALELGRFGWQVARYPGRRQPEPDSPHGPCQETPTSSKGGAKKVKGDPWHKKVKNFLLSVSGTNSADQYVLPY